MYLAIFITLSLFVLLLIPIKFFVKRKNNKFEYGLLFFKKEVTFRKRKDNSFKKIKKDFSLIRNIIARSNVTLFDVTTYTKISGDVLEPFYYTFLMASINSIKNTINYYSYGIDEERYNNVVILEGKNKIDFKCIFSIKMANIIIAIFKWIGDLYGKSSRRNA